MTFVDSREQAQLYNFRVVGCRFKKKKCFSKVKWQQKKISKGTYIVCIAFWNIVYLCFSDVEWPIEDKIQKGEYIQHFRDFKKTNSESLLDWRDAKMCFAFDNCKWLSHTFYSWFFENEHLTWFRSLYMRYFLVSSYFTIDVSWNVILFCRQVSK